MVSSKFFDDHYFNNTYYAKVGGILPEEANELEVEFLFMCNFSLHVGTDVYAEYFQELRNHSVVSCAWCRRRSELHDSATQNIPIVSSSNIVPSSSGQDVNNNLNQACHNVEQQQQQQIKQQNIYRPTTQISMDAAKIHHHQQELFIVRPTAQSIVNDTQNTAPVSTTNTTNTTSVRED